MADLDWFPFEPGRWLTNTLHLTARQHGAYLLLTCAAFEGRGILPSTDAGLMSIAKLDAKAWKEDGPVLKAFLTREGDAWVHEFARHLRADAEARVAGKSKAGKAGAEKRWNGRGNGTANSSAIAVPSKRQWQNDAHLQGQEHSQGSVTTTHTVANSAPAREPVTRSVLLDETWEPSEADKTALKAERPDIVGEVYDQRMRDFRDWCAANATRTFNPAATWRGFMRKTKRDGGGETFDQRRIRLAMEAIR